MTHPPDRTGILEVEVVTIPVIMDKTRDVEAIGGIRVVIMAVTTVRQKTLAALLLGVE